MTAAQEAALAIAKRDGVVVAGTGAHAGRVERVAASTIRALVARGLLAPCFGGEGHTAGKLVAPVKCGACGISRKDAERHCSDILDCIDCDAPICDNCVADVAAPRCAACAPPTDDFERSYGPHAARSSTDE